MKSIKKILATLLLLTVIVSGVSSINALIPADDSRNTGTIRLNDTGGLEVRFNAGCPMADIYGIKFHPISYHPGLEKAVDKNLYNQGSAALAWTTYTVGENYVAFGRYKGILTDSGFKDLGPSGNFGELFTPIQEGVYAGFYGELTDCAVYVTEATNNQTNQ